MMQAKKEATEIAEKYADLKEVDRFIGSHVKTYFSLTGKMIKARKSWSSFQNRVKKAKVLAQKDGLTEKKQNKRLRMLIRISKSKKQLLVCTMIK